MSKITHEQALRFNEKAMQINKIVFSIPGDNTVERNFYNFRSFINHYC